MYAVLAGKLAAEVIVDRINGNTDAQQIKPVHSSILEGERFFSERTPMPVYGNGAIAFGGGAILSNIRKSDKAVTS